MEKSQYQPDIVEQQIGVATARAYAALLLGRASVSYDQTGTERCVWNDYRRPDTSDHYPGYVSVHYYCPLPPDARKGGYSPKMRLSLTRNSAEPDGVIVLFLDCRSGNDNYNLKYRLRPNGSMTVLETYYGETWHSTDETENTDIDSLLAGFFKLGSHGLKYADGSRSKEGPYVCLDPLDKTEPQYKLAKDRLHEDLENLNDYASG